MPQRAGAASGKPLIFCNVPPSSYTTVKQHGDAAMGEGLGANPAHWVIHDLRRTMVTKMAEDLEIDPIIFDHQSGEERSNLAVRFGPG